MYEFRYKYVTTLTDCITVVLLIYTTYLKNQTLKCLYSHRIHTLI